MKVKKAHDAKQLTDIPNIGPAIEREFNLVGVKKPNDLKNYDGYSLYVAICDARGTRMDPCVLDTCLASVDFMNGASAKPWWSYTSHRKQEYPDV